MSEENELIFNIITLGDAAVGKTSIIRRYIYDSFDENSLSTIGLQFSFKTLTLKNKKAIKLKLVDTAGQEKYRSLTQSYYKNADAALFVFSLDNIQSFQTINDWIQQFKDNHENGEKIPKYLVGNKNDLERKVSQELIDELNKKINFKYISTSAKNNDNIDFLFEEVGEELFKRYKPTKNQKKLNFKQKQFKNYKCSLCNEHK